MEKSASKKGGFAAFFDRTTGAVRRFVAETTTELKRCVWPSRQELLESTILVVVATVVLAVFVAGVDEIATRVIRLVTVGKF